MTAASDTALRTAARLIADASAPENLVGEFQLLALDYVSAKRENKALRAELEAARNALHQQNAATGGYDSRQPGLSNK